MCRTTSLKSKIFLALRGNPSFPLRGSYKFGIGSMTYSGRLFSFETINNVYNKCLGLEDLSAAGAATFVSSVNCELLNMLRIIKKMLCCHCNPLHFSPFKNLPTTNKWTTKFWQQNSKLLSFFSDLVFMWGHFSCACNWPFCAERRCDLVAQVLAWKQQNMGSLPAGFPAIAPKKWQQQNQKVMTLNAEKNEDRN